MNKTKTLRSLAERWTSWVTLHSSRAMLLLVVVGIVVVAGVARAVFNYRSGSEGKSELLTYRLCVGPEQKLCPNDATFVRNDGEDAVARWTQRECASYKARRIVIRDAPTKDCDCTMADVICSTE